MEPLKQWKVRERSEEKNLNMESTRKQIKTEEAIALKTTCGGTGEEGDGLFSVGDVCVAKWSKDQVWYNGVVVAVKSSGSFVVDFVDYGNSETIFASSIVKDGSKIPVTVSQDQIDENVYLNAPETEVKLSTFSSGDTCVARWNEDLIWYNGKITEINGDGSFMVNFVDYGNTDLVMSPFIVQNASDIPKSVSKDEIDENVKTKKNVPSATRKVSKDPTKEAAEVADRNNGQKVLKMVNLNPCFMNTI